MDVIQLDPGLSTKHQRAATITTARQRKTRQNYEGKPKGRARQGDIRQGREPHCKASPVLHETTVCDIFLSYDYEPNTSTEPRQGSASTHVACKALQSSG